MHHEILTGLLHVEVPCDQHAEYVGIFQMKVYSVVYHFACEIDTYGVFVPRPELLLDAQIMAKLLLENLFDFLDRLLFEVSVIVPAFVYLTALFAFYFEIIDACCSEVFVFGYESIMIFFWKCVLKNMAVKWVEWIVRHVVSFGIDGVKTYHVVSLLS